MARYLVETDLKQVPDCHVTATDPVDLGHQVALHLHRHHAIKSGAYDAQVGDRAGAIHQQGLRQPVTFTIHRED